MQRGSHTVARGLGETDVEREFWTHKIHLIFFQTARPAFVVTILNQFEQSLAHVIISALKKAIN